MEDILDVEDEGLELEENTHIAYKNSIKGILSLVFSAILVIVITLVSPIYKIWTSPVVALCFSYALGCALPGTIYSVKSILKKEKNTFKKIFAIIYNGIFSLIFISVIIANVFDIYEFL